MAEDEREKASILQKMHKSILEKEKLHTTQLVYENRTRRCQ